MSTRDVADNRKYNCFWREFKNKNLNLKICEQNCSFVMWKKKVHPKRWTTQDRSYLQWCRVRWTIGTASGNQKRKTRRLKIEILSADKLTWEMCIPEQEPTKAIWYIKLWYFCIECQSFFHLWRVTAGHKYLYFFFSFFTCYFLWVWLIFALLLFDIVGQKRVWTYCNNKCCFLDVNCIVGEGLNLSATNFTSVSVCENV